MLLRNRYNDRPAIACIRSPTMTTFLRTFIRILLATSLLATFASPSRTVAAPPAKDKKADAEFLDELQLWTFKFFWETANPENGLVPDRLPTKSFCSVAAVGFGLAGY